MYFSTPIEYLVAQVQHSRVTHVNGEWKGSRPPTTDHDASSCPYVWDWLGEIGREGWRMTAATESAGGRCHLLYLSRG